MTLSNARHNSRTVGVYSDLNMNKTASKLSVEEKGMQLKLPSIEMLRVSREGSNGLIPNGNGRVSQLIKPENDDVQHYSGSFRKVTYSNRDNNIITRPVTLVYIRRFINQLKKSIYSSLYKNINTHQLKLINDYSHYEEG